MTLRLIVKPAFPLRKKRSVETHALRVSGTKNLHFAIAPLESRSQELPLQPLAERYVNLSIHTAPIKQTHLSFLNASGQTSLDVVLRLSKEIVLL